MAWVKIVKLSFSCLWIKIFFSPKAHVNPLKRAFRSGLVYDCFAQV